MRFNLVPVYNDTVVVSSQVCPDKKSGGRCDCSFANRFR